MASPLTNDSAFFTAIHTETASSSGGSPTALLERMFSVFASFSIQSTLKTGGRSWMLGILYVVGECESSLGVARIVRDSAAQHRFRVRTSAFHPVETR